MSGAVMPGGWACVRSFQNFVMPRTTLTANAANMRADRI
jgi:hypothetical protein